MDIGEKLTEELECRVAFTIPVLGGIPVPESCVMTWGIMACRGHRLNTYGKKTEKSPDRFTVFA